MTSSHLSLLTPLHEATILEYDSRFDREIPQIKEFSSGTWTLFELLYLSFESHWYIPCNEAAQSSQHCQFHFRHNSNHFLTMLKLNSTWPWESWGLYILNRLSTLKPRNLSKCQSTYHQWMRVPRGLHAGPGVHVDGIAAWAEIALIWGIWVEHRSQAQLSFFTTTTIILQDVDIYPIIQDAAKRSPRLYLTTSPQRQIVGRICSGEIE